MTRTERRLAERFNLKIPLRVRIAEPATLERTAESLNISTRGISLTTKVSLCKDTPVHLVFEMPEEVTHKAASEWRCTGHVVHVQPNSSPKGATCVGVRFDCYEVFLRVGPPLKQVSQLDESMDSTLVSQGQAKRRRHDPTVLDSMDKNLAL